MKIVICEDMETHSEQLAGLIREWESEMGVVADIFRYESAEDFLENWQRNGDSDIIFLDIIMGDISGMALAELIRKSGSGVPIVFVSNRKEYTADGYEVEAMHYLAKPAKKEKVFNCLDRANQIDKNKKYILCRHSKSETISKIFNENIIYIEKFRHNAEIVTANKTPGGSGSGASSADYVNPAAKLRGIETEPIKYVTRITMEQMLKDLDDDMFVQCHRSYIINLRRIASFCGHSAVMSNGAKVSVAQNKSQEIMDRLYSNNVKKI